MRSPRVTSSAGSTSAFSVVFLIDAMVPRFLPAAVAWFALTDFSALAAKAPPPPAQPAPPFEVRLADLDLATVSQGVGRAKRNTSVDGTPLRIGGKAFEHGVGTHARSEMRVLLDGKALRLTGACGPDDASAGDPAASVEFEIVGDGAVLWRSGVMKAGAAPATYDLPLDGVKELRLRAGDAGDGMAADRADWAGAVVQFTGQPPQAVTLDDGGLAMRLPPVKEAPGGPPNAPAEVKWDALSGNLQLTYGKRLLMRATLPNGAAVESQASSGPRVEQRIAFSGLGESTVLLVHGGPRAMAAETRGDAQRRFPLVRTAFGASDNLRNNAVYDPDGDWMLEFPEGKVRIAPFEAPDRTMRFEVRFAASDAGVVFRPRYFQKHRNLPYYQPWANPPREMALTVWDAGAAYAGGKVGPAELKQLAQVWQDRRLGDFGCAAVSFDMAAPEKPDEAAKPAAKGRGKTGKAPASPAAAASKALADGMGKAGIAPGLRLDAGAGRPADALSPAWFRGWRKQGFTRFLLDGLDRQLYDRANGDLAGAAKLQIRPEEPLRAALAAARKEAGRDVEWLAGRGVMPELIGLAGACRLGGPGYAPATLQQYNSWNGLVWRNDPGPCDVVPGGFSEVKKDVPPVAPDFSAAILRPAVASIAGAVLTLGDKAAVYQDDRAFAGLRRVLPVVPSVPGQLYDYDDAKSAWLSAGERTGVRAFPAPSDPDPAVPLCPWWLNEFSTAAGHWFVLHRVNAGDSPLPRATVWLADLGIDPKKRYFIHEFWSDVSSGLCRDSFDIPELPAKGVQSFAIRESLDRPQVVSTSSHLSQGAVDLLAETWDESTLTLAGQSRVVAGERYVVTLAVPEDYRPDEAAANDRALALQNLGRIVRFSFTSTGTGVVGWRVGFMR